MCRKKECEAFNNGHVHLLPVKEKKLKTRTRWLYYFIIESAGSVYIRKREEKDIWQNLHEFVLMEKDEPQDGAGKRFSRRIIQAGIL